jgi:hypothetical protein
MLVAGGGTRDVAFHPPFTVLFAGVAGTVPIGIRLIGVGHIGTVVAGVPDSVCVVVGLIGVCNAKTVILGIGYAVVVAICTGAFACEWIARLTLRARNVRVLAPPVDAGVVGAGVRVIAIRLDRALRSTGAEVVAGVLGEVRIYGRAWEGKRLRVGSSAPRNVAKRAHLGPASGDR